MVHERQSARDHHGRKVGKKGGGWGSKPHGPARCSLGGRRDRLTGLEALGRSRKSSEASTAS